eukprot:TRINITY_DN68086_c1_g3_i2.p1 TRINITY_DN68086_c1_g3~~TRINITY_DN68086_c1_g3_i2.p1  ORF type:complete len:212 (-),score=18.11 TRINITY_DN68086_c1_g3_i2:158-766(-)
MCEFDEASEFDSNYTTSSLQQWWISSFLNQSDEMKQRQQRGYDVIKTESNKTQPRLSPDDVLLIYPSVSRYEELCYRPTCSTSPTITKVYGSIALDVLVSSPKLQLPSVDDDTFFDFSIADMSEMKKFKQHSLCSHRTKEAHINGLDKATSLSIVKGGLKKAQDQGLSSHARLSSIIKFLRFYTDNPTTVYFLTQSTRSFIF